MIRSRAVVETLESRQLLSAVFLHGASQDTTPILFDGHIYFGGTNAKGTELCRSDGTAAGTELIKDVAPGFEDTTQFLDFTPAGSLMYFRALSDAGDSVWVTDGTQAGTKQLYREYDDSNGTAIRQLTAIGQNLYFIAPTDDAGFGKEAVWKSDGTPAGTGSFAQEKLAPGTVFTLGAINGELCIVVAANDSVQLFTSDGTDGGTQAVNTFDSSITQAPEKFVSANGKLYFSLANQPADPEFPSPDTLWSTEGTADTTAAVSLSEFGNPDGTINPLGIQALNDHLIVATGEQDVWITDGTNSGSVHLRDTVHDNLTAWDGEYYFTGSNGRMYRSDGTSTALQKLRIQSSYAVGEASLLGEVGHDIYFSQDEGDNNGIWKIPGGTGTPQLISSSTATSALGILLGGKLFYIGESVSSGFSLLQLDPAHGLVWGDAFLDSNRDGRSLKDHGLVGARVYLDANKNMKLDAGEQSMLIGSSGIYEFDSVVPGYYDIRIIPPDTSYFGTTPLTQALTVGIAPSVEFDVGMNTTETTGIIQGTIFDDHNGDNSLQTGESPVEGVRVWVDLDGDGKRDANEPTAVSDADGHYVLTKLPSKTNRVHVDGSSGWFTSRASKNVATLGPGQAATRNIGVYRGHVLSGRVFDDQNLDGKHQATEPFLSGQVVQVVLQPLEGSPQTLTTVSGKNGKYSITLPPYDPYTVFVADRNGRLPSNQLTGTAVIEGASIANVGSTTTGIIEGDVFNDENGNGIDDEQFGPQDGWTVFLDTNGNRKLDNGETSMVTTGGTFSFKGISPGVYHVAVQPLDNTYKTTTPKLGKVTIGQGTRVRLEFGFAPVQTITGVVFVDKNQDSEPQIGELTGGATVFVDLNADGKLQSNEPRTTSGSKGQFTLSFPGELFSYSIGAIAINGMHAPVPYWFDIGYGPAEIPLVSG